MGTGTSSAALRTTAAASENRCGAITTIRQAALMMPAFSAAICVMRSPKMSVCFVGQRGDHRGVGAGEDVGAVESSAEPDFDHLHIDVVLVEGMKAQRGEDLEGADVTGIVGQFSLNHVSQLFAETGKLDLGQGEDREFESVR